MKHVGVLENNPTGAALTGRCLDALTIVTEGRVLGTV
jgi:hypothetical protein